MISFRALMDTPRSGTWKSYHSVRTNQHVALMAKVLLTNPLK
jgi:hypothetical protein